MTWQFLSKPHLGGFNLSYSNHRKHVYIPVSSRAAIGGWLVVSFAIKQLQGAPTTKQLLSCYFMKAYITIVLSVALGIHTAAPCSFEKAPSQWISEDSTSPLLLCLFTMWESKLRFLFSGVVSPISGLLNVWSSPRGCPHCGLTRPKTLQLNPITVHRSEYCWNAITVQQYDTESPVLVRRSWTISAILVHQPETVFTTLMHIKDSLSTPLHCTSAHRPVSDCM